MAPPPSIPRGRPQDDSKRNETLARTAELTVQLLHVEKMEAFLQGIAESVRSLFGFDRVSISILDEERKVFSDPAMAGYSEEDKALALENADAFSMEEIMSDFKEDCRVSRFAYFIPFEMQTTPEDFILVRDSKAAQQPRSSPESWHELDLLYFALNDRRGNIIGYMQVDYPRDKKIPSLETIQEIELFASVAAVGIENSKMFTRTRGYLDLLTHDVGNLITPVDVYLDVVMATTSLTPEQFRYISNAREAARNITVLVSNLRKSAENAYGLHTFRVPQGLALSLRQSGMDIRASDSDEIAVADIEPILKGIKELEPLDVVLHRVARTICVKLGVKYGIIGVKDDSTGLFKERVVYGVSSDRLSKTTKQSYTLQRMRYDLRDEFLIAPDVFYVRPLETGLVHKDDLRYIDRPELTYVPRKSTEDWQELDYMDFMIKDRAGQWIGWVEILETADARVPSRDRIEGVRMLADLAGIAIESDRLRGHAARELEETTDRLGMITDEVGNKVSSLVHYNELMSSTSGLTLEQRALLESSERVLRSTREIVVDLKKIADIKALKDEPGEDYLLKSVLERCVEALKKELHDWKIVVKLECDLADTRVRADRFVDELFMGILRTSVRSNDSGVAELQIKVTDGDEAWIVEIRDRGRGVPDDIKKSLFDGTEEVSDLGPAIAGLLASRYHGSIVVRDRVHGRTLEGANYEVRLPKSAHFGAEMQSIENE